MEEIYSYDRTSVWDTHKVSNDAQWEIIRNRSFEDTGCAPKRFSDQGKSGGIDDRPALNKLISEIKRSYARRKLYVWRYDRLFRKTQKALKFVELCHNHNVEILSISEPLPEGSRNLAFKTMYVQLLFINADMQREITIENIRSGLAYKKSKGEYLSSSVPFGYRLLEGKVIQEKQEAKAVKRLFELYVSGAYGYKKLVKKLTEEGVYFYDRPFKVHNVCSILTNPIYYGMVKGGTFGEYRGNFEPIISELQYKNAQAIRRSRNTKKLNHRHYPLRKKISCPFCDRRLSPMQRWNYSKTKRLHYYHCANRECQGIYIPADKIEKKVLVSLKSFVKKDTVYQEIITEIEEQLKCLRKKEQQKNQNQTRNRRQILQQFEEGKITLVEMKQLLTDFDTSSSNYLETINHYQSQLDQLLELQDTSVQQIFLNHVADVSIKKDKQLRGISLQGIPENIYVEK